MIVSTHQAPQVPINDFQYLFTTKTYGTLSVDVSIKRSSGEAKVSSLTLDRTLAVKLRVKHFHTEVEHRQREDDTNSNLDVRTLNVTISG